MDKKSADFGDTLLGSSEIFVRFFFVGFVIFLRRIATCGTEGSNSLCPLVPVFFYLPASLVL